MTCNISAEEGTEAEKEPKMQVLFSCIVEESLPGLGVWEK